MPAEHEKIVVDVPEGFLPMCTPVDPEERIPEYDIVLSRAQEGDLEDIATGMYTCFPEMWWASHEPAEIQPSPEVRRARLIKRMRPWLTWPGAHPVKASLRSTGEFVGLAVWHEPSEEVYKQLDGKWMAIWRRPAADDPPNGLGFAKHMGWSDDEVEEMWKGIDIDHWEEEWATYDQVRTEEMGSTLHWYLAPIFVMEKFRGRGVGRMLLEYAFEKADAQSPPTPVYLESLPNATPVYLHCGFEQREGYHRETVMIRNPPK